jgi:hypothetical protein
VTFRRTRGVLTLGSFFGLVIMAVVLLAVPSNAAVPTASLPPTGAGIDISHPQCVGNSHVELPGHIPFAVIGVNGGVASTSNPCFSSEYNSAYLLGGVAGQPGASVYVNTGNPSLAAAWWPTDDHTQSGTAIVNPNGACAHLPGAACAYIYGYSMAQADFRRVSTTPVVMPTLWWLDVETSNTWQADVAANSASLSGMVDFFKSKRLDVGLYSTSYQWNKIAGVTPATSNLAGLPSWLAGGSFLGAPADCEKNPLTPNGRVAMVQYVMHFDNNYACRRFAATSAAISPINLSTVGALLKASSGQWDAGPVSYSYQWNRNGTPIAGAKAASYRPIALDAGSVITVTISGFEPGYSAASDTSGGVSILAIQ